MQKTKGGEMGGQEERLLIWMYLSLFVPYGTRYTIPLAYEGGESTHVQDIALRPPCELSQRMRLISHLPHATKEGTLINRSS